MKRELLATIGDRTLVVIDGVATIEERGVVVHTEDDGEAFQHYLGVYFGWRVELAMAVRATHGRDERREEPPPAYDERDESAGYPIEPDDDDGIPF